MSRCKVLRVPGSSDYLSKSNGDCLKGIFSICVLLHHLYLHTGLFHNTWFGAGLQFLGYFSVGMFFFLSGYGLIQALKRKEYLDGFPRKRLLPFYFTMVFLVAIYAVFHWILKNQIDTLLLLQSLLFGGTVISNGWYLQVQLLFYLIFYLVFRFCKKTQLGVIMVTLLTAAYCFIMAALGFSSTWYVSIPLFVAGIWFSRAKSGFDKWILQNKNCILSFLMSGVVFVICLLGYKFCGVKCVNELCITLSECAFVFCVLIIVSRVRVNYRLTRMLGSISFEIYIMQGLPLTLFHSGCWNIQDPLWYSIAVVVSTVLLAAAVHPIIKMIFLLCGGNRGEPK